MGKRRLTLEDLDDRTCGACGEPFRTVQGVMAHQSSSRKCAWYKKGKLKAIFDDSDSEDSDLECEVEAIGRVPGGSSELRVPSGSSDW